MSDVPEPELDGESFNANYKVLKETADWLSRQEEPDIDQLVPRVERAMRAYRICKRRREAVQDTLGTYLQKDPAPTPGEPAAARRPSRDGAVRDGDGRDEGDELPF